MSINKDAIFLGKFLSQNQILNLFEFGIWNIVILTKPSLKIRRDEI